jgi:hypothetical protein
MMNSKTHQYLMAAALAVGGLAFAGCDNTDTTKTETRTTETRTTTTDTPTASTTPGTHVENALDKTGDALKSAAEKTGNVVDKAVDKTGAALKNMGSDIRGTVRGSSTTQPGGTSMNDTDGVNGVREQVSEIAEAALTENGIDNIGRRLADSDQKRLHDLRAQNTGELKTVVESIQKKWKDKYGGSFDMDAKVALNDPFMTIANMGEARTAGERQTTVTLPKADVDVNRTNSGVAGNVDVQQGSVDTTRTDSARTTGDAARGNETATVSVPASHGLPPVTLQMVRQDASWKLDLPDSIDEAKLGSNLLTHLRQVDQSAATWPADKNEAYRVVTHHVLMALTDQPAGASATPSAP